MVTLYTIITSLKKKNPALGSKFSPKNKRSAADVDKGTPTLARDEAHQ